MIGNMFKKRILERGYNYYIENRVRNVVKNDGIYHADIDGSEIYHVSMKIYPEGKIGEMKCNCPNA